MSYVDIYTEAVVIQFLKNGMWFIYVTIPR